ncbi:hypothetical protein BD311DRAFT_71808 [Dichomitus squalens]|uniref:Uncharacterized protein n=1 Tax=Dichomitus squalens TaxID=114155 RepID=A0A4Q9M8Z2_9APHY|nr:hypothetical protein BD311DRAFT_71808 [Dichomitus squalens]
MWTSTIYPIPSHHHRLPDAALCSVVYWMTIGWISHLCVLLACLASFLQVPSRLPYCLWPRLMLLVEMARTVHCRYCSTAQGCCQYVTCTAICDLQDRDSLRRR